MSAVLVVDAKHQPLHRVSVKHAIGMLVREVAVVVEADDRRQFGPYPVPRIIRLLRKVAIAWRNARGLGPACSKNGVRLRDGRCAYCGRTAQESGDRVLTVDHIMPKSRGGASSWMNLVASCLECNHKKADRTPEEAGMSLLFEPYVPNPEQVHGFMTRTPVYA